MLSIKYRFSLYRKPLEVAENLSWELTDIFWKYGDEYRRDHRILVAGPEISE